MKATSRRLVAMLASATLLCSALSLPTVAHASHGIKCGWVLVSQVGNTNIYAYVCSRGA